MSGQGSHSEGSNLQLSSRRSGFRAWIPLEPNEWGLLAAIVLVLVLTTAIDPEHDYFFRPLDSAVDILRRTSMLGIFALGSAMVIIAGGIDLSSGSVIAFSGTVCGTAMLLLAPNAMQGVGTPLGLGVISAGLAAAMVAGLLIGSLHAWLITVIELPPFVATLATLVGLRSLGRAIIPEVTGSMWGRQSNQIQIFDDQFRYLSTAPYAWVPFVVFLILSLVAYVMLSHMVVGRHLYALGGNEEAARLSGIRTDRLKWLAYCFSAVLASVAGVLYIAEQSVADPQTLGRGYELNAIAAAVVGGCSLRGGKGGVLGTVLGCLFLSVVIDGVYKIIASGADVYEGLIVGGVVVVAVAFSQLRGGGSSRRAIFPGALGIVAIFTLVALAGTIGTTVSRQGGLLPGATMAGATLIVLVMLKTFEVRRRQRAARSP